MNDFNNRISAQRDVLELINCHFVSGEQLFGLSKKAIDRWCTENNFPQGSNLHKLLIAIADVLFFLANKSQEQVTHEYQEISTRYGILVEKIRCELNSQAIVRE